MQNKSMQLFILPYAGGSSAAFKKLEHLLDPRVETVTVEYPGHGTRAKEPLTDNIWKLIADAVNYIDDRRDSTLPYCLMGYSMGSVLAYELLMQNKIRGELKHLFIAAEVPPKDRYLSLRKSDDLTEEKILERAKSLGGLDERMLKNKRFRDIYIAPMLSDYRAFFAYKFAHVDETVNADTTIFYCEKDTRRAELEKWKELIEGKMDFHELGENHFFIHQYYREMADVINDHIREYLYR